jgi:hypothetical protein
VSAKKQLSKSKAQWAYNEADSDDYSDDEASSEEETSDHEIAQLGRTSKKRAHQVSASEDDSEEESDEEPRLQSARKRQAEALKQAKASKTKKKTETKKKPEMNKNSAKKRKETEKKKSAGKKGSPPQDSFTDDDHDPMDDIDMDHLIQEAMQGSQMSVLHSLCWFRIILDEAHVIKSRSSQTANASFSLIGIHRWCLSGTPLQNRVGELYSLIRFLRVDPMAHYFCRAKVCQCLATAQPRMKSFSIQLTFPTDFS